MTDFEEFSKYPKGAHDLRIYQLKPNVTNDH